jgi:fructokinase
VDADAQASYDFYQRGTADWQWTAAEISRIPADTAVLHLGSVASWTPPGDRHIHTAVSHLHRRGQLLISYDPNIRPALLGEPSRARPRIEQSVAHAHIVKASREDAEWLYPGGLEHAVTRWLTLGTRLVVITDGADGAHAFRPGRPALNGRGHKAAVVDTVGAGDAFTAGLLSALVRRDLHIPEQLADTSDDALASTLDDAVLVSALTCERTGADPPTAATRPHHPADAPLTVADLRFTTRPRP